MVFVFISMRTQFYFSCSLVQILNLAMLEHIKRPYYPFRGRLWSYPESKAHTLFCMLSGYFHWSLVSEFGQMECERRALPSYLTYALKSVLVIDHVGIIT